MNIYFLLHCFVRLHKIIEIYLFLHLHSFTLARSENKFHYGIYTYTECKSQTIYKQLYTPK